MKINNAILSALVSAILCMFLITSVNKAEAGQSEKGAWVLWTKTVIVQFATPGNSYGEKIIWEVFDAYPTFKECRTARQEAVSIKKNDVESFSKNKGINFTLLPKDVCQITYAYNEDNSRVDKIEKYSYHCLPESVDPREKK